MYFTELTHLLEHDDSNMHIHANSSTVCSVFTTNHKSAICSRKIYVKKKIVSVEETRILASIILGKAQGLLSVVVVDSIRSA